MVIERDIVSQGKPKDELYNAAEVVLGFFGYRSLLRRFILAVPDMHFHNPEYTPSENPLMQVLSCQY